MKTVLRIVCCYCQRELGIKEGNGTEGDTGSICEDCWKKHYPRIPYEVGIEALKEMAMLAIIRRDDLMEAIGLRRIYKERKL